MQNINLTQKELKEKPWWVLVVYYIGYIIVGPTILGVLLVALGGMHDQQIEKMVMSIGIPVLEILILALVVFLSKAILVADKEKLPPKKQFFLSILIYWLIFFAANFIVEIPIALITGSGTSENQQAIISMGEQNLYHTAFLVLIFAPIVEELVFRGALYHLLRRKLGVILTISINSLAFALIHMASLLTGNLADLIFILAYITMGVMFGVIYHKTQNIYICMGVHFIQNTIIFISVIIMK